MKQAWLLLLLLAIVVIGSSGCWDHREIEQVGIVLATGVEKGSGENLRVIAQVVAPALLKGGGGGMTGGGQAPVGKPYRNLTAEGPTIFEALRGLLTDAPRYLFFGHNQEIIFSEEVARHYNICELLDFFDRSTQVRRSTYILVYRGQDLHEIFDIPGRVEPIPANRVMNIINNIRWSGAFAVHTLGDFAEEFSSDAGVGLAAGIRLREPEPGAGRRESELGGDVGERKKEDPRIQIAETAVFKNGRLIGWFDMPEIRGLLFLRCDFRNGSISIPCPHHPQHLIALEIFQASCRQEPYLIDDQPAMRLKVKVDAQITETQAPEDLENPQHLLLMEQALADAIRADINRTLARAQGELKADAFHFASAFHRRYPRRWREEWQPRWDEIFPRLPVEVEVEAVIRRTGLVGEPLRQQQKPVEEEKRY